MSLLKRFGKGSNSFLTQYAGYHQFQTEHGYIAYVDTPQAWVAATEPFCEPEHSSSLLNAFREEARKNGKEIFVLPVSEPFAQEAKRQGYSSVMIGTEPVFELKRFFPDFKDFHSAKHLGMAGAKVLSKSLSELTERQRAECDDIFHEWLSSRWMAPLSFLNQVSPWECGEHKRYFILFFEGRFLGFLAAVPIWATQGWYFVDLLKRKDAPPGSTEIILLEAMRILKEQGAQWISLGLSPLSGMEQISWREHPLLYKLLNLVFHQGNAFYRFRPLFEFKKKLKPTDYPLRYLIASPKALRPRGILSLMQAFVPGGLLKMVSSSLAMKFRVQGAFQTVQPWIRPDIIARALPKDWIQLVRRCRFTLGMVFLNLAMSPFMFLKQSYSFSWGHLKTVPLLTLAVSPFLHENAAHLTSNLALMLTGMSLVELLIGLRLTLAVFVVAASFSNVITLGVLRLALDDHSWLGLNDVGASLGIFGCLGALCFLIKARHWFALFINSVVFFISILGRNWMGLDHIVAFWIGYAMLRFYFQGRNARPWTLRLSVLGMLIVSFVGVKTAWAEPTESWTFLPESRHEQYQPYAFFTDEQSALVYRSAGRAWGAVGGAFALADTPWFPGWKSQPQLVFIASANAGYRINAASAGVFTDTIDARIGFNFEAEPAEGHRILLGFLHMSGHVSDDIQDSSLIGLNFGWEEIRLRYIYAGLTNFRLGGTLSPVYSSDPKAKIFSADQFFEWFPNGLAPNRKKGSLYFSAGLEQYGANRILFTMQGQVGVLFGNHDRPVHEPSFRVAAGYYTGADPRLKYMGFYDITTKFAYAGVFVDL